MERSEQLTEEQEAEFIPMTEPEMDDDGYPTERTLHVIQHWPYREARACLEFCARAWRWPDWVGRELEPEEALVVHADEGDEFMRFATGGWSGNEDIIAALRRNRMIQAIAWRLTSRGGLHIYTMPKVK